MQTWQDAELGEFAFNNDSWSRLFDLPAFSRLTYRGFFESADGAQNSLVPLAIVLEDDFRPPTPWAISLAQRIVANHRRILDLVLTALLEDIKGEGPKSGTWWNGEIERVRELIPNASSPGVLREKDICSALGLPSIIIKDSANGDKDMTATMAFECIFEPEHGVGILTNGERVVGIGSALDIAPFN